MADFLDLIAAIVGAEITVLPELDEMEPDEVVKALWDYAITHDCVDLEGSNPMCEALHPATGKLFVFERLSYDSGDVIECEGVVVHRFGRRELGRHFETYCAARDSYDKLTRDGMGADARRLLARNIERLEESHPDFRQAYEDRRNEQMPDIA